MIDYRLTRHGSIVRLVDGANIPADPANSDCAAYLAWVEAGGIPDPAQPPTAAETNASIDIAIAALEAKQARPLREYALGDETALARAQDIDDQIAARRAQRVP